MNIGDKVKVTANYANWHGWEGQIVATSDDWSGLLFLVDFNDGYQVYFGEAELLVTKPARPSTAPLAAEVAELQANVEVIATIVLGILNRELAS